MSPQAISKPRFNLPVLFNKTRKPKPPAGLTASNKFSFSIVSSPIVISSLETVVALPNNTPPINPFFVSGKRHSASPVTHDGPLNLPAT